MSNCSEIIVSQDEQIMRIEINRPQKKNALSAAMYDAISSALLAADDNPDIRVILLHGNEESFSSGNDIKDFTERDTSKPSPAKHLLMTAHALRKPLVAAVSGLAVGIGTTILLHCDLVYAATNTRFRLPFVDLGLCPEAGSSLLLPSIAGHRQAAEVLMLGDFFNTDKAIQLGIVNQSVAEDRLLNIAMEKAKQLAKKPQQALIETKRLLKQGGGEALKAQMQAEFESFGELLETPESKAILSAFLNASKNKG